MAQVMNVHRKPLPSRRDYSNAPAPAQQHVRARTNSSGVMPIYNSSSSSHSPPLPTSSSAAYTMTHQQPPSHYAGQQRRTLSNATSSTSSSHNNLTRAPTNSNYSTAASVRRSTSSRSNSSVSPTSYVALMRKQKATVWCDRAQHEDPRILVAQKQARMRAAAEVAGGQNYLSASRTSTNSTGMVGGVRSKIRHHGAPKASTYKTAMVAGAGVPMRLSASEVDDGNHSDEETSGPRYHVRHGSGRSNGSGSARRAHSNLNPNYSNGNTPPGASPVDRIGEEPTPTPPREGSIQGDDYFNRTGGGDGDSGSSEEKFGDIGGLPARKVTAEEQIRKQQSNADDLRRRGSVDERTMTMSGPRLFVANPDLSD